MFRKSIVVTALIASLTGCVPDRLNNTPPRGEENWELIANTTSNLVYKVVDTEDSVICYMTSRGGISCLAYYHEGSNNNYRQVD